MSPEFKEIAQAKDIGKEGDDEYAWIMCEQCNEMFWALLIKKGKENWVYIKCDDCVEKKRIHDDLLEEYAVRKHYESKRSVNKNGYVLVRVPPGDFFEPMAMGNKRIQEHRLVMAKHLGRLLQSWEIVHHINGIKDDNRIENLQLVGDMQHRQITVMENRIKQLEKRIDKLTIENDQLKAKLLSINHN